MDANMWSELLKNSPSLFIVLMIVLAFLKNQRDITNDFKGVVSDFRTDMKTMHGEAIKHSDVALIRIEQAAHASTQNAIATTNNSTELAKLSQEIRRLADRQGA